MQIETEIKAKCRNLPAVKWKLRKIGAKFVGKKHQLDTYYLVKPKRGRYHSVPLLRIREDKIKNDYLLEFHKPVNTLQAIEYELKIDNSKVAKEIIEQLGYPLAAVVEKVRERYAFDGLSIDLDEVKGLGRFIEIECMRNKKDSIKRIYGLFEKLGIPKDDLIPDERYVDMVWAKTTKK